MNSLQHLHIYSQSLYLTDLRRNEDEGVERSIKPFGSPMRTLGRPETRPPWR